MIKTKVYSNISKILSVQLGKLALLLVILYRSELTSITRINSYKPQIEEALVEVEKLGDNRQSQMNRVKLVEKEKGALEVRRQVRASLGIVPY